EEYDDRAPEWADHHFRAWSEDGSPGGAQATLEEQIELNSDAPMPVPDDKPTMVMLTSGTTGTPKGAPRQEGGTLITLGAIFERVPFRTSEVAYIAPPFFHALGFATFNLMLSLGNEIVTQRRFNAEAYLQALADHRVTTTVVVPAMLQRVFE